MLGVLRLIIILGMILFCVAIGFGGLFFYEKAEKNIVYLGSEANMSNARHLEMTVWKRYRDILSQGLVSMPFKQAMSDFLADTHLVGLRIYDSKGVLLYTTGGTLTSSDFNRYAADARLSHNLSTSELTTSSAAGVRSPTAEQRRLLRSFIILGKANSEGYAEIFHDVTDDHKRLMNAVWILIAGIAFLFLLMFLALFLIRSKAEGLISTLHERNVELERVAAYAEKETKQKTLFLANISHELRTPLNAIIGFSEILKTEVDGGIANNRVKGYVDDIHASGVHLLSLINDILDFSKAEAGKLELEIAEVNASKLAISCFRLVAPRAEEGGVNLVNNLPKEPLVLETDAKKFKQVLLNLLSNAVKFTPTGGTVQLTGWFDMMSGSAIFQVSDTGIGIDQKDIAKALSAFGQVDNKLSRQYEGTGLGLPLTRKFVELMGGKFSMKSEPDEGTTITFSLPLTYKSVDGVVAKRTA